MKKWILFTGLVAAFCPSSQGSTCAGASGNLKVCAAGQDAAGDTAAADGLYFNSKSTSTDFAGTSNSKIFQE